jgi:hypothetical protein
MWCVESVRKVPALLACIGFCVLLPRDAVAFCQATTCDPRSVTCATDAHGCMLEGAPLYWEGGAVTLDLAAGGSPLRNVSPEDFEAAANAAMEAWQNVTCADRHKPSLRMGAPAMLEDPVLEFDEDGANESVILFLDGTWPFAANAVAKTSLGFYTESGNLDDADIALNSNRFEFTTSGQGGGPDLQAVLTHEIGHALGLDHSDVEGATMAPETDGSATEELRSLEQDDVDAICSVYPFEEPPQERSGGDGGGCSVAGPARTRDSVSLAWSVMVGALARRAHRRRRPSRAGALR